MNTVVQVFSSKRMCQKDDVQPPRKKIFCEQFECVNVEFVNIMIRKKYLSFEVYIKNVKTLNKFYYMSIQIPIPHIDGPELLYRISRYLQLECCMTRVAIELNERRKIRQRNSGRSISVQNAFPL